MYIRVARNMDKLVTSKSKSGKQWKRRTRIKRKGSLDRVAARTEQHPEKSSLGVRVTST